MTIREYFSSKEYPGRIIISGTSAKGERVLAYAIMGRSENSRNRIFTLNDGVLRTKAYDESAVADPSLIIYTAKTKLGEKTIVSNGDQSDTIEAALKEGKDFSSALAERTYEPDAPSYTPRISLVSEKGSYSLSIIRKNGEKTERMIWTYPDIPGFCHTIHTYKDNGNPLPSFEGNPVVLELPESLEAFRDTLWQSLNHENRISLYVSWGDKEEIINSKESTKEKEEEEEKNRSVLPLKYGLNPNQKPAFISCEGEMPLSVLNGKPGFINLLDALNGWLLVSELKKATDLPAAASFKHVSPAGAAVAVPLTDREKKMYFVSSKTNLSPLATAYVRARGADRMSSFGDFIALSDECDEETARIISREVSDGVIAPGYSEKALEILKNKKGGAYTVLKIDESYIPPKTETRTVYGITFSEPHNDTEVTEETFQDIVSIKKDFPDAAKRDMTVALITLKYTQSNSVVYAKNGQTIGVGAGQQSRIHCTRLAGDKADRWWMRQCPKVLSLPFKEKITRNEKDNIIEQYLSDDPEIDVVGGWKDYFSSPVYKLTKEEKKAWMDSFDFVSLSSDAFFPFRDNIDRARKSGVRFITEPGGSMRDSAIVEAADEHEMTLIFTHSRLFHH